MLDGVTPFPAEFAARYRALGYWEDRPLFDGFRAALAAHADRVAVIDEAGPVTHGPAAGASAQRAPGRPRARARPGGPGGGPLPDPAPGGLPCLPRPRPPGPPRR